MNMVLPKFVRIPERIKRHKYIAIGIAAAIIVLVIIFRPKSAPPLETYTVKQATIVQALSASGTVDSVSTANLNFLTGGKLTYVGATKGEEVQKGQVIATVDQRSVQKNLENAMLEYAKQRNTFEELKDDEGVDRPEDATSEEVKRILENNQHDLDKAVISVELQELAREQSVLVSPIDGVLVATPSNIAGVNVSITSTFTVADPYNLIFKIDVDEADIGKVRLQQPINIYLDAYPDRKITVPVSYIDLTSHKTDTGANAFTVEAVLPENNSFDVRIGMSGDAEIITAEKKRVVTMPIAALEDEQFVYVQKEKGYEKRRVALGIQSDTEVEIKSGLKTGEVVALQPEEAKKLIEKK